MTEVRIKVTLGGLYSLKEDMRTLPGVGNVLYLEFHNGYVGVHLGLML